MPTLRIDWAICLKMNTMQLAGGCSNAFSRCSSLAAFPQPSRHALLLRHRVSIPARPRTGKWTCRRLAGASERGGHQTREGPPKKQLELHFSGPRNGPLP